MADKRKYGLVGLIIGGGLLIILAALSWAIINKPSKVLPTPTPASESQVQRVALPDAKAVFDARSAVFVDVRDNGSYAASHIPGALSIPLTDLPARAGELNQKAWIIPYCT